MKIVFYDTETSGTDPAVHDIIQIAAAAFNINGNDWELLDEFECKMLFDTRHADIKALLINHFNADIWEEHAVSQAEGLRMFDAFVKPHKDVWRKRKEGNGGFFNLRTGGHNIIKFDDLFVRRWYKVQNKFCPFDYQEMYDTLQLAKWQLTLTEDKQPADYKLGTLCKLCNVPLEGAHDALADVMANARLAWRLIKRKSGTPE